MKKLFYGPWEYTQTNDPPADPRFVAEYGGRGYLLTRTQDGTPAIHYEGTFYRQERRYRDGETAGKRIHDKQA
jgi:hypothetical protein